MNPLPAVSLLLVTASMEICVFNEEKSLTSAALRNITKHVMMKNKTTDLKEDIMTTIAKIKEIVLRFMKKMKKDRVSAAAAESAFFVIMGFVPFFMLLLTLVQYTELSPEMVMSILMEMLPASFYDLIVDIVKDLFTQSTALMSGTVIAAVWATSRSVLAITNGLNSVRSVGENRNYFYMRMRSGIYIVFLVIAIFRSIVMLLFVTGFRTDCFNIFQYWEN